MNREEMVEKFQCPGCVNGPDPASCPQFRIANLDLGGFRCHGHVRGTTVFEQHPGGGRHLLIHLGLPQPFASVAPEAATNNLVVLIDEEGGRKWLDPGTKVEERDGVKRTLKDSQNIPVWKMKYEGCTLVRIARPASCRYTTLVIDGDVDVPEPAIEVGRGDRIFG